jgi:hypothetical protein
LIGVGISLGRIAVHGSTVTALYFDHFFDRAIEQLGCRGSQILDRLELPLVSALPWCAQCVCHFLVSSDRSRGFGS